MGIGLGNALQIAKSSLLVNQYLINVNSQNVANANTPGYTRQEAKLEAARSITNISPGSFGTGVQLTEIVRTIDNFLEAQLSKNVSEQNNWEIANKYMENIEKIFSNQGELTFTGAINDFFNAWYELSNNPSDYTNRTSLLDKSQNMLDYFHSFYEQLTDIQGQIDSNIADVVGKVNSLTKEIAELNQKIFSVEIDSSRNANDLRDRRDALVKELSQYIDINYIEESKQYNIFTANGNALVTGSFHNTLKVEANEYNNNLYNIYWVHSSGSSNDITKEIGNGELKGLLYTRDEVIPDILNRINNTANAIMREVNKLHSSGVGLETYRDVVSIEKVHNKDLSFAYAGLKDPIQDGTFSLIVYDENNNPVDFENFIIGNLDQDVSATDGKINSLQELADSINSVSNISAYVTNNKLFIKADNGYTFAFADDTSGVLSALGINTFFKGTNYDLQTNVNVVGSEAAGNADNLYEVTVYNKKLLNGHEYEINYDNASSTLKVVDTNTGKEVSYIAEVVDGKITIDFDGIRVKVDNNTFTGDNTYYIKGLTSKSVVDEDKLNSNSYRIDFKNGTNNISIIDINKNISLKSDEYSVSTITDGNGDNQIVVEIINSGITITVPEDTFGVVEITPQKYAAKNITNAIDDVDLIAAGKVQTPEVDDSDATIEVSNIDITDISALTNKQYIITIQGGNYNIIDEDGNTITPTNSGNDFVEFDGVRINFSANVQDGDKYTVKSGQLIYSEGDNRTALEIAKVKDKEVLENNAISISEYSGDIVAKVGLTKQFIENKLDAANILHEGLQKQRDDISGISLDEEMTRLIQVQQAYIASSKLIGTIDKLMNILLQSA